MLTLTSSRHGYNNKHPEARIKLAKSFVKCPSCKCIRRTELDTFKCCTGYLKTKDHLADPDDQEYKYRPYGSKEEYDKARQLWPRPPTLLK